MRELTEDMKDAIRDAVKDYVWRIDESDSGRFELFDPRQQRVLILNLMEDIEDDRIFNSVEDETIACVDMMSPDGVSYDVDFILTDAETGAPVVRNVAIHKVEDYPRYAWEGHGDHFEQAPAE